MTSLPIGEAAAVAVSVLWTVTSLVFSFAGKRIGAYNVNVIRTFMAVILLLGAHLVVLGTIIPGGNDGQWLWLGVSGVIGLAIGDFGYFLALIKLGPRRAVLLMALAPIFTVAAGAIILRELPGLLTMVGIAITLAGVFWVILERDEESDERPVPTRDKAIGLAAGVLGGLCQGVGLVISKYGMVTIADDPSAPLHPVSATLIRMVAALAALWITVPLLQRFGSVSAAMRDIPAMKASFVGSVCGPFLGVTLSMVAVTYAIAGVASTLMSLMPIFVIPVVWLAFHQKTTNRGIAGAIVAVIGVAILFLVPG